MNAPRIVIIGGGFAGVACAAKLRRARPSVEVVLFNAENHIVFTPLLAEVVGSAINPLDVVVPLRQLLPGVHCRTEEVSALDPARHEVEYRGTDGRIARLRYDHLVLACGQVPDLGLIPGMADHAFPLKTIGDAVNLRSHVMEQLERAETCADPVRRLQHLAFLVVGGGYSGVEAAGEIHDLVGASARYFRNFRAGDVTVNLIHARDQLLPEIGAELRAFAQRQLEQRGIRVLLNARVSAATGDGVVLSNGTSVPGRTIVCTVGSSPAPLLAGLAVPKVNGRIVTEPDLRVAGMPDVWAIGDCAHIINAHDGRPAAPTGQFAERQGRQCAENILRRLRGQATQPFAFRPLGQLCSIGGHAAVAELFGFRLAGFFAWLVWRGVYLFKLPTWARRAHVGVDWAWLLLFPRDLAHLRSRPTDRVARAHFRPGAEILSPHDVPGHLLVIESGEVEILRVGATEPPESFGVLGAGGFLGEKAFHHREPFGLTARARTPVTVLQLGREASARLTGALAPLKHALTAKLRRRPGVARLRPEILGALRRTNLRALMEPYPLLPLLPTATLHDVGRIFAGNGRESLAVCTADGRLEGVVTMTDWSRAVAAGLESATPVGEFMTPQPHAVTETDDLMVAAALLREYELKQLPVVADRGTRRLVGVLRAQRLLAHVYQLPGGSPTQLPAAA